MADGGSLDGQLANLHSLLDQFSEAPFTMQRLCEVLLEPRKQYRRLDKLVRPRWGGAAQHSMPPPQSWAWPQFV